MENAVLQAEIDTLLHTVDFSHSPSVLDMCAESGELSCLLSFHQFAVVSNSVSIEDPTDHHYDALQPRSSGKLRSEYGSHVFVVTPQIEFVYCTILLPSRGV